MDYAFGAATMDGCGGWAHAPGSTPISRIALLLEVHGRMTLFIKVHVLVSTRLLHFCQPHIVPRLATVQKLIRPSEHCRAHLLNFSRPHAGRHMERHMRLHGDGLYPATSFPRTQVHHVAKRNHPLQGWLGRPDINNKRQCLSSGQRDIFRHRRVQNLEIAHHAPIVGGLTCLSSGGKSHCTSALTAQMDVD